MAVLPDATDALDGCVLSEDVTDDTREAEDTFLGASIVVLLSNAGIDGFLNSPLMEGLLVGREAIVLAPNLETGPSGALFSGLGVLERGMMVEGDWNPWTEARTVLGGAVFAVVV